MQNNSKHNQKQDFHEPLPPQTQKTQNNYKIKLMASYDEGGRKNHYLPENDLFCPDF